MVENVYSSNSMRFLHRLNLRYIWIVLLWMYIGSIWIWFVLRLVFFDRIWWLSLLNTNAFYLLIPVIIFLPIAIRFRLKRKISKCIIAGLILPGILFIYFFGYLLIPPQLKSKLITKESSSSIDSTPTKFKAMTFNVLFKNEKYSKIAQTIRSSNPDVIGLQEVQSHHIEALKQILIEYPYVVIHPVPKYHNIAFFSRLPIESVNILPESSIERGMSIVVKIQNQLLTVIITHLTPNYIPPEQQNQYSYQLQSRYTKRAAEIDYLLQFIHRNPHPSIVLCDCNLTDTSQTYPQLVRGLSDSFAEAGWGFGHTFQGEDWKFPLQRLDYIWHSDRLTAVDAYVGEDGGSDHLPLVANFHYLH
jgi:vancomycin resistance protein VanJ